MSGQVSLNPLVSVIIPNYNHAPFLKERIDSVLNQSFDNFEVIILDDKSTDHSKEVIESYRNHEKVVHIEYNSQNSGSTFKQWDNPETMFTPAQIELMNQARGYVGVK